MSLLTTNLSKYKANLSPAQFPACQTDHQTYAAGLSDCLWALISINKYNKGYTGWSSGHMGKLHK